MIFCDTAIRPYPNHQAKTSLAQDTIIKPATTIFQFEI